MLKVRPKSVNKNELYDFLNVLEPESFVQAFLTEPPEGFESMVIHVNGMGLPGFIMRLDLLTTADERVKRFVRGIKRLLPGFSNITLKSRSIFIGTTVSEYSIFPRGINLKDFMESAVSKLEGQRCNFLVVKDIPLSSPLLSDSENAFSKRLISFLANNGFTIVYGQVLGFVPIDFSSTEEYLERFSKSKRKDMKRKLRSFSHVSVEPIRTGDDFLDDPNIDLLYTLYLNVYENSDIHFDKLTVPFFREVLKDKKSNGIVFLYRHEGKIVGFNLCYVFGDYLVDKYIGFLYPDSRKLNLYFLSWFHNLSYCIRNNLKAFIVGWTDPAIKEHLGAEFTHTCHAVYIKNPFLRFVFKMLKPLFEPDKKYLEDKDITLNQYFIER